MPLQNRVTPEGEIVTSAARGTMMGNRGGRLHAPDRTLRQARWVGRRWICCELAFKDRRRRVMGPGYTELFFLDEATALAAGHRPCFECRRAEAQAFAALFGLAIGLGRAANADEMDLRLHAERLDGTRKRTFAAPVDGLPDGIMFRLGHSIAMKRGGRVLRWSPTGYNLLDTIPPDVRTVEVLTPPSTMAVLALGYAVRIHASAE